MLPLTCRAASNMANTALGVRVEPAAVMTVSPMGSADNSSGAASTVRIDLTIRLNSGTTASLVLYPGAESSGASAENAVAAGPQSPAPSSSEPRTVLTVSSSGRYSVDVAVGSLANFGQSGIGRLELRSSDQALGISETF